MDRPKQACCRCPKPLRLINVLTIFVSGIVVFICVCSVCACVRECACVHACVRACVCVCVSVCVRPCVRTCVHSNPASSYRASLKRKLLTHHDFPFMFYFNDCRSVPPETIKQDELCGFCGQIHEHTHTHTHTHTRTFSLSLSDTHTHNLSLSLTHTHILSLSLSLSLSHTHTHARTQYYYFPAFFLLLTLASLIHLRQPDACILPKNNYHTLLTRMEE